MTYVTHVSLFLLMAMSYESLAATINLSSFDHYKQEEHYLIDASFDLNLSDEALEALKHGIPLQIRADCEVKMVRNWYPDKTIKTINYVFQLLQQPLTEDYLSVNLKTGLRVSHDNLSAALMNIGRLTGIDLINGEILTGNSKYMGRIRMYLDLDSLPSPMRPQVYFSDKWDISSDWHEWIIKE